MVLVGGANLNHFAGAGDVLGVLDVRGDIDYLCDLPVSAVKEKEMTTLTDGREFLYAVFHWDGFECKDLIGLWHTEDEARKQASEFPWYVPSGPMDGWVSHEFCTVEAAPIGVFPAHPRTPAIAKYGSIGEILSS